MVEHIHNIYGNLHPPRSGTTKVGASTLRIFLTGYSAGSNVIQRVLLHSRDKPCAEVIQGALCVCINYDYLTSRRNLESTTVGCAYSMLMTYALKDIIRRNAHVHEQIEGGSGLINRLLTSCTFMSDYDRLFAKALHSYVSVEDMNGFVSMHDLHRIDVPLLAVQPSDDPLHMVRECVFVTHVNIC